MASRMTSYRHRLKETNPEKYQIYLDKQRERSKKRRDNLKKELCSKKPSALAVEQKKHLLEKQRERQKKYNMKRIAEKTSTEKDNVIKIKFTPTKHVTRNKANSKKEYNRIMKQKSRALMSPQKRTWERKKDRLRKAKKAAEKRRERSENDIPKLPTGTLNKSPYSCKKTEQNVTSSMRKAMPDDANKFAKIVHNLIDKASPRKKNALKINMNGSGKSSAEINVARAKNKVKRKSSVDHSHIKTFFKREDISRVVPQKRFATKEGPGYLMQVSVKSAYEKYLSEHPGKKVSFSKFASLRPKNVRKLNYTHREYCVCTYCINVRFKLLTLSRASSKKKTNEKDLLDILLCDKGDSNIFFRQDCIDGQCSKCNNYQDKLEAYYEEIPEEKILSWCRWETPNDQSRKMLVTKSGTKQTLLKEFVNNDILKPSKETTFPKHLHTALWQSRQFSNLKNDLPKGWTLSVMDFAKNRDIIYQDEVKAAFYTSAAITIHPIVSYYHTSDGIMRDSTIIISQDLLHDYHAVKHYSNIAADKLNEILGKNNISKSVVFSDGCAAQYKSRGPFADISLEDGQINRNYFGSEHGKGDCDAETGILNRALDRAIIGKQVIINNADDLYNFCREHLEINDILSRRTFRLVKNGDIDRARPETLVKTLPKTRKLHQLLNIKDKPYQVLTRNLSCFCKFCTSENCQDCLNREYVSNFERRELKQEVANADVKTKPNVVEIDDMTENIQIKVDETKGNSTDAANDDQREEYFGKKLQDLTKADTFSDLATVFSADDATMQGRLNDIQIFYPLTFMGTGMIIDGPSQALLPNDIPLNPPYPLYPARIYGDGNCLPRCASVAAFGNENHFKEMRYRIAKELTLNKDFYLDDNNLLPGKHPSGDSNVSQAFASVSDCYTSGRLTKRTIKSIFHKETMSITKPGSYMGMWQLSAIANILNSPLVSVCPSYGNYNVRPDIHRVFYPRNRTNKEEPIYIMWTNTNGANTPENRFVLNHFVLLMPLTAPTLENHVDQDESLLDLSVSFDETGSDIFEDDTCSTIQDIILDFFDKHGPENDQVPDGVTVPDQSPRRHPSTPSAVVSEEVSGGVTVPDQSPRRNPSTPSAVVSEEVPDGVTVPDQSPRRNPSTPSAVVSEEVPGGVTVPDQSSRRNPSTPSAVVSEEVSGGVTVPDQSSRRNPSTPSAVVSEEVSGGVTVPDQSSGRNPSTPSAVGSEEVSGGVTVPDQSSRRNPSTPSAVVSEEVPGGITVPDQSSRRNPSTLSAVVSEELPDGVTVPDQSSKRNPSTPSAVVSEEMSNNVTRQDKDSDGIVTSSLPEFRDQVPKDGTVLDEERNGNYTSNLTVDEENLPNSQTEDCADKCRKTDQPLPVQLKPTIPDVSCDSFQIGCHVLIKHGTTVLPAVIIKKDISTETDNVLWIKYYSKKRGNYFLDPKEFTIVASDIVKTINPPDLVWTGGSRFSFKFDFL